MADTSKQYDKIVETCRNLFINKMKDYGSAWRILRLPSLTDQIFIKTQRIRGLQKNEVQKVDEGQVSEFIGVINYSIMALVQLELGIVEQPDLKMEENRLGHTSVRVSLSILNHRMASITNKNCKFKVKRKFKN